MRSLRRPKHTVHPASRRRMKDTKVIQKPALVVVIPWTSGSLLTWCLRNAYSAMSTANAISVKKAAKKDVSDESKVMVTCCEAERSKAMNVTAVATG